MSPRNCDRILRRIWICQFLGTILSGEEGTRTFRSPMYRARCCNRCLRVSLRLQQGSTRKSDGIPANDDATAIVVNLTVPVLVLACCCCNRRVGGSWLTQWETRPPGKYPLMPAKLPHSRTSLCPVLSRHFHPPRIILLSLFAIFRYTFLFPLLLLPAALYTLRYTAPFAFSLLFSILFSISIRNGSACKYLESSFIIWIIRMYTLKGNKLILIKIQ